MDAWRTDIPPNEQYVEVDCLGKIIQVMAIHGRDGVRPHWRNKEGSCWEHDAFIEWRHIQKELWVTNI